jgi:hypothetical protein
MKKTLQEIINPLKFWKDVDIQGPDDCWPWLRKKDKAGYGRFARGTAGRLGIFSAHRTAYYLTYGEIPKGLFVLHSCDYRCCCNPKHLRLGTQSDNMKDMWDRGRANRIPFGGTHSFKGETNPRAILSESDAREILELPLSLKSKDVAKQYGVATHVIWALRRGDSWKHLQVE